MPTKWYTAKIIRIEQSSSSTKNFFFHINGYEAFDFLPGQFITMDLPIGEKRLNRWRSYSIASRPSDQNLLECCIVLNKTGIGSPYLFGLEVGDEITFKGPDGGFVLPSLLDQEIIMVCTGTGIAPFMSMIRHIDSMGLTFQKIHLIFGTRYAEDILYKNELEDLKSRNSNFYYDVTLSRDQTSNYHFGYVHDIYLHHYRDVNDKKLFMLCGWSKMIDEAVANLVVTCGYKPGQVRYELYG